jgi:hypothetical protein
LVQVVLVALPSQLIQPLAITELLEEPLLLVLLFIRMEAGRVLEALAAAMLADPVVVY